MNMGIVFCIGDARVGSPPCLNVDAVKLIEATPSTARGQSFEELSHLGNTVLISRKMTASMGKHQLILMEEI